MLPNGNLLILSGSGWVDETDSSGKKFRSFLGLNNPFDADRLANGNTIVADSSNNRLVEFGPDGKIVWKKDDLPFPNNVFRLNDGRTLYTTYTSGVVAMLNVDGEEIWQKQLPNSTLFSVYCDDHEILSLIHI